GTTIDANEVVLTAADALGGDFTVTLPAITGTVGLLEGTQTFTGAKTFSDLTISDTNVSLSGASSALSATNDLTITAGGANNLTLSSDFNSGVTIGSATTQAPLSIQGGI